MLGRRRTTCVDGPTSHQRALQPAASSGDALQRRGRPRCVRLSRRKRYRAARAGACFSLRCGASGSDPSAGPHVGSGPGAHARAALCARSTALWQFCPHPHVSRLTPRLPGAPQPAAPWIPQSPSATASPGQARWSLRPWTWSLTRLCPSMVRTAVPPNSEPNSDAPRGAARSQTPAPRPPDLERVRAQA